MSAVSQFMALKGRWSWRRFEHMTKHPEEVQRDLLQRILKSNQNTAYGLQHGFSGMTSVQDYQDGVPVGDYEALRPWVDRLKEGERRVLTSEDPYLFALTSGTAGQPKFIPVNRSVGRTAKNLSRLWLYRCLVDHPKMLDHKALVIVSPAVEGSTGSGIPFGSASGYIYKNASWVLRRRYAVPYPVFAVKDFEAKYYAIMRFAIEQPVSLIATPNPSTILRLAMTADKHRDRLYKDIHDGAVSKDFDISSEVRRQINLFLKPNPKRARELESIVAGTGSLRPKEYWPDLALVGCWKGGSVGSTVDRLRPWFRTETPFRDIGYLSSEAYVTLPTEDEGCRGILAVAANFYEFIPEGDMESARPHVLTVSQLENGESYYIVLTSPNGLYRYDINDIVRVAGFHGRTPMLEFMRKGRDMVNLEGEKLHVSQLIQAVEAAQTSAGIGIEYYRAVGHSEASRYTLQLELKCLPVADKSVIRLGRAIDDQLASLNIEYDQKRRSGRLHPPLVQIMAKGWSSRRLEAKLAQAVRDIQFKDNLLGVPDEDDHDAEIIRELTI